MESIKISEKQRKTSLLAREIHQLTKSFIIIPYQVSGYLDYTNRGFVEGQVEPSVFETFKRVWTGNDAVVIQWKNSIKIQQRENGSKRYDIIYQLGEFFAGEKTTDDSNTIINKDTSFSEYTSQEIEKRITISVDAKHFTIPDYYQLLLYKIPEYSDNTLYYLESIERTYIGLEIETYVLDFVSINQKLANTGRARQQNIQNSAPGQGYLEPMIKHKKDWEPTKEMVNGKDYIFFADRYILANYEKTKNDPVFSVVVKQFGVSIPSTIAFIGRPASVNSGFNQFEAPRLLFPINIEKANTPNLFRTSQNNTNYYYGRFQSEFYVLKDFLKQVKDLMFGNQFVPNDIQGVITYNRDIKDSNKVNGETKNFNYEFNSDWEIPQKIDNVKTYGSFGVAEDFKVDKVAKWNRLEHKFFQNYWIWKGEPALPFLADQWYKGEKALSGLLDMFIFPIASILTGGKISPFLLGKLNSKYGKYKSIPFYGFIPTPFFLANEQFFSAIDKDGFPMGFLNNDEAQSLSNLIFPNSSIETSFRCNLTDQLEINDSFVNQFNVKLGEPLTTLHIGQKKYSDEYTDIRKDGKPFLMDGEIATIKKDNIMNTIQGDGYIIDAIQMCSIFNGEFSIEFLNKNNQIIWSGIYQSEGKWTGSMRDIWTMRNVSVFGRENMFFDEPMRYPQLIEQENLIPPISVGQQEYLFKGVWFEEGEFYYNKVVNENLPFPGLPFLKRFEFLNKFKAQMSVNGSKTTDTFNWINNSTNKNYADFSWKRTYNCQIADIDWDLLGDTTKGYAYGSLKFENITEDKGEIHIKEMVDFALLRQWFEDNPDQSVSKSGKTFVYETTNKEFGIYQNGLLNIWEMSMFAEHYVREALDNSRITYGFRGRNFVAHLDRVNRKIRITWDLEFYVRFSGFDKGWWKQHFYFPARVNALTSTGIDNQFRSLMPETFGVKRIFFE